LFITDVHIFQSRVPAFSGRPGWIGGCVVQKRHLSVREYAAAYGVSPQTIYAMCAANKLAHVRLGTGRGTIRIAEDAVVQMGNASTTTKRIKTRDRVPPG
jgi:excisionase family DNA binding protein